MAKLQEKKLENNHISISLQSELIEYNRSYFEVLGQIVMASFIYLTITLAIINMFQLSSVSPYVVVIGIITICFHQCANKLWNRPYLIYLLLTLLMLLMIIFQSYIVNGLFLVVNQIADVFGHYTPIMLMKYSISIDNSKITFAINLFVLSLTILFSLFISYASEKKINIILYFIVIFLFTFQLITGISPKLYYNIMLFFTIIVLLHLTFLTNDRGKRQIEINSSLSLVTSSLIIFTLIIFFVAILSIKPLMNLNKPLFIKNIEENTTNMYERFKYGKNDAHSLTEGNFKKLNQLTLKDEEVMEIVMSNPNSYYLRGFVGGVYTEEAWEIIDNRTMYENYNLIYWLDEIGVHPLRQLSVVNELGSPNEQNEKNQIIIKNSNASSKYIYTPYELNGEIDGEGKTHWFKEFNVRSNEFFGHRHYSYDTSENLVKYYPRIASRLYSGYDKENVKEYLDYERHYNQFIYEQYTQLTEDVETLFDEQIGKAIVLDEERATYEEAIDLIDQYLDYLLTYEEKVKMLPKNTDFISFLFETREGYAPHYATLATAMFRYFGIPSRYVEGFLVTPNMVKEKETYARISVTGKEAHAWTEIYIDEIGWIPLEFTPPYKDVMEPVDMSEYPKGKWTNEEEQELSDSKDENDSVNEENDNVSQLEDDQFDDENNANNDDSNNHNEGKNEDEGGSEGNSANSENGPATEEPEQETSNLWKAILLVLFILFMILLLVYAIYVTKKRLELRRLKKIFYGENINEAVVKLFSYTLLLFHYDGIREHKGSTYAYIKEIRKRYGNEYATQFKNIIEITQAAAYSNREILVEEHEIMLDYNKVVLEKVKESKNLLQRLKMMFWDFIY